MNFSFSNPDEKENNNKIKKEEMEYDTWAERIKGQYSYFGKPSDTKPGAWVRRSPKNHNPDEGEFRWLAGTADDGDGSGTPSPELWKRPQSSSSSSPLIHVSHSARAQTIAKYRQEMLDLVRGMPETAYELSLRDIVESPKIDAPVQEADSTADNKSETETDKKKKKKKGRKGGISRSESIEIGGLMLKMFSIPKVNGVLRGRKSGGSGGTGAKVSPNTAGDEEKSSEREWWSEEFVEMTSSSGSSSSNNSSSGGRRRRNGLRSCYPFFHTR